MGWQRQQHEKDTFVPSDTRPDKLQQDTRDGGINAREKTQERQGVIRKEATTTQKRRVTPPPKTHTTRGDGAKNAGDRRKRGYMLSGLWLQVAIYQAWQRRYVRENTHAKTHRRRARNTRKMRITRVPWFVIDHRRCRCGRERDGTRASDQK